MRTAGHGKSYAIGSIVHALAKAQSGAPTVFQNGGKGRELRELRSLRVRRLGQ
jgi:hypothetical protein